MATKKQPQQSRRQPSPGDRVIVMKPRRSASRGAPLDRNQIRLHVQKMLAVAGLLELAIGDPELEKASLRVMQILVNRSEYTLAAVKQRRGDQAANHVDT